MADLHDFGEKIGGARKDLWQARGLSLMDLTEMTGGERKTHIKKDNIWPRPNWSDQISAGKPQCVAYWQNKMRAAIPPKPPQETEESQNNYVEVVGRLRDAIMSVKEPHEIDSFYRSVLEHNYVLPRGRSLYVDIKPEAQGIVTNKVLKAAQSSRRAMQKEAEEKLFGVPKEEQAYVLVKQRMSIHQYDDAQVTLEPDKYQGNRNVLTIASPWGRSFYYLDPENEFHDPDKWVTDTFFILDSVSRRPIKINFESEAEAEEYVDSLARLAQEKALAPDKDAEKTSKGKRKRKGNFVPPQLKHIKRTGPSYRGIRPAEGDMFLEDLHFRGGEYGNWLNHADRQVSLNMAYDALRDLARILEIQPEDVSLNGSLAIAFGARGRGGAGAGSAHYEPDRQVINLTKMSGAGCLAHEWGHALDHAIGLSCGTTGLASDAKSRGSLPDAFRDIISALKYKTVTILPDELSAEQKDALIQSEKKLQRWLDYAKPSNLSDSDSKRWDEIAQYVIENADTFTGSEYFRYRRTDSIITKPEIEMLSQLRKRAIKRGIPMDVKHSIATCAVAVKHHRAQLENPDPVQRTIKTDYYKGSIAFDAAFSRAGHGYWQSDCEMFARAFDCYIADKFKAEGEISQYLSCYSDCFLLPAADGETIYAFPRGEERAVLDEKFDRLIADLKERGILHQFVPSPEHIQADSKSQTHSFRAPGYGTFKSKPVRYEQMSLEELIFGAQSRTGPESPTSPEQTHQHDR